MYFFQRIKFLLTATNQHGVHSPFVYAFVTKCLYSKKVYCKSKSLNTTLKTLAYFNISQIQTIEKNSALKNQIIKNFPKIGFDYNTTDFVYFEELTENTLKKITKTSTFHNESIVFINAIYKDYKNWDQLIKHNAIKVSLDLFYCGILFFRREQEKEHFKIRI